MNLMLNDEKAGEGGGGRGYTAPAGKIDVGEKFRSIFFNS